MLGYGRVDAPGSLGPANRLSPPAPREISIQMTTPLDVSSTDIALNVRVGSMSGAKLEGRFLGKVTWLKLRRDNWPYMGRITRGRTPYILFREILRHLAGPVLVYSTLLIPADIAFSVMG